jgi:hypothetical protein
MSETQGVGCKGVRIGRLGVFALHVSDDLIPWSLSLSLQASIDEYLQNSPRIVGAVFPDQRKRRKINDVSCLIVSSPISCLKVLQYWCCSEVRTCLQ